MSLNVDGFDKIVQSGNVTITITNQHPLIKLAQSLVWDDLLAFILHDLQQSTVKKLWWRGRPLYLRTHLGIYLLQKIYNRSDREMERALHDNAAFQIFCGHGIVKNWSVPDHTKIEEFRSRLSPQTQRKLANQLAVLATQLKFANPHNIDIDSTIQEANMSYPARANLLIKLAGLAKRLVDPLNNILFKNHSNQSYYIDMKRIKGIAKDYFFARHKGEDKRETCLKQLWREVFANVIPVMKDSHYLLSEDMPQRLKNVVDLIQWKGFRYLEKVHAMLFEKETDKTPIYAFHLNEVSCFNKNKLNKKLEFGRSYQLGRIDGNFLYVGECASVRMADAASLKEMVHDHQTLFGEKALNSIATDCGYYSQENEQFLQKLGVKEIGLQRPNRYLNSSRVKLDFETQERLYNRRSGIEALISHAKHGGQLGRSRMKSDRTTLSAGYSSVLGFNLRQLMRYLTREPFQLNQVNNIELNKAGIT